MGHNSCGSNILQDEQAFTNHKPKPTEQPILSICLNKHHQVWKSKIKLNMLCALAPSIQTRFIFQRVIWVSHNDSAKIVTSEVSNPEISLDQFRLATSESRAILPQETDSKPANQTAAKTAGVKEVSSYPHAVSQAS